MTLHDPFRLLYDKYQSQYRQLCIPARTLAEIGNELLGQVTESTTTPEQIEQLQQSLLLIYKELEKQAGLFHYAATIGPPHTCVKDIYIHASAILKNRAILQQAPPPPPTQQLISREGAVIDLEEHVKTSNEETYLGTDDTAPTNGNTG
jgi:hypothetical protein